MFMEVVFITYLYKEHIRKTEECDISLRLHYSLVFDLSPTLRQIASTPLFGFGQIWLTECYNSLQYIISCHIPIIYRSISTTISQFYSLSLDLFSML